MKYQCDKCKKSFLHTAKLSQTEIGVEMNYTIPEDSTDAVKINPQTTTTQHVLELQVCPFCQSKEYAEFVEPVPAVEEVANVYIYELTTGPQTKLDELLKDGYKIVGRSVKLYQLEKPKVTPKDAQPDVLGDIIKAGIEQAKTEAQA